MRKSFESVKKMCHEVSIFLDYIKLTKGKDIFASKLQ